ncbi:MAG: hypothetical protein ACRYGF_12675 [Janthinobacterium lividum]
MKKRSTTELTGHAHHPTPARYVVGTLVPHKAHPLCTSLQWQTTHLLLRPATILLAVLLLFGCADAARFWKLNQSGAVWADEVRTWRADPAHVTLMANPANWTIRMYFPPRPMQLDLPFTSSTATRALTFWNVFHTGCLAPIPLAQTTWRTKTANSSGFVLQRCLDLCVF